jgi:glutathione synthase
VDEDRGLESFDLVLMRKDPPVDIDYMNALLILEPAAERVAVVNDPSGLRRSNEKLLPLEVPGAAAPSIVTATVVTEFVREHGRGGEAAERVQRPRDRPLLDPRFDLDAESVGRWRRERNVVSGFLPRSRRRQACAGGRREPIGWVNRLPRPGSFLANSIRAPRRGD